MKWIVAMLLVCLLTFSVQAYSDPIKTSPYLVVVGKTAPASDVIIAANFAASMKGSVAVTFQSAIDQDVRGKLTLNDLTSKTVVVVNGKEKVVKILGGLHDDAWDNSREYFKRQGFAVTEIGTGYSLDDLLLNPPQDTTPPPSVVAPPQPSPELFSNDSSNNSPSVVPDEPKAENKTEKLENKTEPAPEQIAQVNPNIAPQVERHGLFARIWDWLTSIF